MHKDEFPKKVGKCVGDPNIRGRKWAAEKVIREMNYYEYI